MRILLVLATAVSITALPASAQADHSARTGHDMRKMSMGDHMKTMEQHNKHMVDMLGQSDAEYDLRFINMMIQHHEGGIAMAQAALKDAKHSEIKEMSKKIIDTQQKEIDQFKTWRKQWYGK